MRLERLRAEVVGDRRRVVADVVWEAADRSPQHLYFEAARPVGDDLEPAAEAFVLACLPFAVWLGEPRIRVDGTLCPRLRDGLAAAMALYARWYPRCRPVAIEPMGGYMPPRPRHPPRTAVFLSGGVDALAALRRNRLDYPRAHPRSIAEALLLFGVNDFEMTPSGPVEERLTMFEEIRERLEGVAIAEGFTLVPVSTTARLLAPDYTAWTNVGFGAATVAVAHALRRRFTTVVFASDGAGVDPLPAGSHPILDQHFATAAVDVEHVQAATSRLDKLRLLADWPIAMAVMQPCHRVRVLPRGRVNCGRCEKCVRTMLGLAAIGKLANAPAFAGHELSAEVVAAIPVHSAAKAELLADLVRPLDAAGRHDLARAVRRRLRRWRWRGR